MDIFEIPNEYHDYIIDILPFFPKTTPGHGHRPKNKVMRPCLRCEEARGKDPHTRDTMEVAWEWFKKTRRITCL